MTVGSKCRKRPRDPWPSSSLIIATGEVEDREATPGERVAHALQGLTGKWGSPLLRAILASSNSSKRLSGMTLLRLSLATTISGSERPKINCSSARRIVLLCFRIWYPFGPPKGLQLRS
jgi:hypothetical protein